MCVREREINGYIYKKKCPQNAHKLLTQKNPITDSIIYDDNEKSIYLFKIIHKSALKMPTNCPHNKNTLCKSI